MVNVLHYHADGANRQAQGVLAMFQYLLCDGIEDSYNEEYNCYDAEIKVARWENCREQGYILSLNAPRYSSNQLNIAFFEHRNHDGICALKWEQYALNTINIDTIKDGAYESKWDSDYEVKYGEAFKMAKWIHKEFTNYWRDHANDKR